VTSPPRRLGTGSRGPPPCPGCGSSLAPEEAGTLRALRCGGCRGLWVDRATFERLCAAPPAGAGAGRKALPGRRVPPRPPEDIRYRKCPECRDVMNRINFGRVSGVVVDVCRAHGAFLDAGELSQIRAFLAAGGAARHAAARDLALEEVRLRARRRPPAQLEPTGLDLGAGGELLDLATLLWP